MATKKNTKKTAKSTKPKDRCDKFAKATAKATAKNLREYQMWRRGEGKYDFPPDADPLKRADPPFTPKELGVIEDRAIELLESI